MKIEPGKPFSSGTEYEMFLYNFCYRCNKGKLDQEGFAESPEEGGCPVWDAMEWARLGDEFPSKSIIELIDEDEKTRAYHVCRYFETKDKKLMKDYELLFED